MPTTTLTRRPKLGVAERVEGGLRLTVEMPGLEPDDVKVSVEDGVITVSGQTSKEARDERDGYVWHERRQASFHRTLPLPEGADAEKITTSGKDGIIEIMIPTAPEA